MFTEEKQNFPTYQDSDPIKYPQNEREVSNFIKKFYKSNVPIELIGSGSKKKNRKTTSMFKNLKFIKTKWNYRIFTRGTVHQGASLRSDKANTGRVKKK